MTEEVQNQTAETAAPAPEAAPAAPPNRRGR